MAIGVEEAAEHTGIGGWVENGKKRELSAERVPDASMEEISTESKIYEEGPFTSKRNRSRVLCFATRDFRWYNLADSRMISAGLVRSESAALPGKFDIVRYKKSSIGHR